MHSGTGFCFPVHTTPFRPFVRCPWKQRCRLRRVYHCRTPVSPPHGFVDHFPITAIRVRTHCRTPAGGMADLKGQDATPTMLPPPCGNPRAELVTGAAAPQCKRQSLSPIGRSAKGSQARDGEDLFLFFRPECVQVGEGPFTAEVESAENLGD